MREVKATENDEPLRNSAEVQPALASSQEAVLRRLSLGGGGGGW